MTTPMRLPEPVAAYFSADRLDADAVAQCFDAHAVVKDEGKTYSGLPEIKRWKAETSAKFTYRIEPLALERQDGITVVTSRLTGNFPGSPVTLRFAFRLQHGKISSLEIAP
jgi:hypothetical protein